MPLASAPDEPPLPPSSRDRNGSRRGPDLNGPPPAPVRGFRDITADADDLGRAAAQASRAARKTYANVPSPSPEFDRLEPSLDDQGRTLQIGMSARVRRCELRARNNADGAPHCGD